MPYNFWDFIYNKELETAVPRELQEKTFKQWNADKSKKNMTDLVKTFNKLVASEISKYQGTLDKNTLYTFAKKYVADAIRNYKPNPKTQLSTHIVNNLQRLHSLNYKNVQGMKIPEEIQGKMVEYQNAINQIEDTMGVVSTDKEIGKLLGMTESQVKKMKKFLKYEHVGTDLSLMSKHTQKPKSEEALDFLYYDLPENEKRIIEYKTGYNNTPIIKNTEIAKKLKVSPVRVTQIANDLQKKLNDLLYNNNI